MNKLFLNKDIEKTYWAIVKNIPNKSKDTLINWLKKNPKNNKSTAYPKQVNQSKKAILHYKVLHSLDRYHFNYGNFEFREPFHDGGLPAHGDENSLTVVA